MGQMLLIDDIAERIARVGAVARRWLAAQSAIDAARSAPDLTATPLADVAVSGVLGEGRRCVVFAATARGRPIALKVYRSQEVAKHVQRQGYSLARYEYERNVALRRIPRLTPHVAVPIGWLSAPRLELFVQEQVCGMPLDTFLRTGSAPARAFVLGELRAIVEYAHDAGLFDLDLHPSNVRVRRCALGRVQPVLFDFNKAPYHIRPPNPLARLLLHLGLITAASRDHRYLRRLNRLDGPPPSSS